MGPAKLGSHWENFIRTQIIQLQDYCIELIKDNNKLNKKIYELESHIKASPDGELYFQVINDWEKKFKNKTISSA